MRVTSSSAVSTASVVTASSPEPIVTSNRYIPVGVVVSPSPHSSQVVGMRTVASRPETASAVPVRVARALTSDRDHSGGTTPRQPIETSTTSWPDSSWVSRTSSITGRWATSWTAACPARPLCQASEPASSPTQASGSSAGKATA